MAIFPALGLAVLGIFVTIVLSGVLAGIIAFGLIDSKYRERAQQAVILWMIDLPARNFIGDDNLKEIKGLKEGLDFSYHQRPWWGEMTLEVLLHRGSFRLAELLQLDSRNLFRLPYRQLCGQIANGLAAETRQNLEDEEDGRLIYALTMLLVIADNAALGHPATRAVFIPFSAAKTRAMAFIDRVQMELAEQVQRAANRISLYVIAVILIAILVPSLDALNLFYLSSSHLLQTVGGIGSLIVAPFLIITLALAARIVAALTFRWIDRFASAR